MENRLLLPHEQFQLTIQCLCRHLIENHDEFSDSVLIGLQPRGIYLADRVQHTLQQILGKSIACGRLDVTFFRDDFRTHGSPLLPNATQIDFIIENKKVVLIDDVLYTGRTIRAGLDAMLAYGRPAKVELLTLVNRRFSRQLPIEPDYVGITVDTITTEKVRVQWQATDGKDEVYLF